MATDNELKVIRRLPANWAASVETIREMRNKKSAASWRIADVMLELVPIADTPENRYLLRLMARETGYAYATVTRYRVTARAWPPDKRLRNVRFGLHQLVENLPDREEILRDWAKSGTGPEVLAAKVRKKLPEDKARETRESYSNISKAAQTAIEVLQRDDLDWERRGQIALSILVKFFEDWAIAHAAA